MRLLPAWLRRDSGAVSAIVAATIVLPLTGCRTPPVPGAVGAAQRAAFLTERTALTKAIAERGPLDLTASIKLALENNLALRVADVSRRLASLDRKAAFSLFLPQVSLSLRHAQYASAPAMSMNGAVTQTGDSQYSRLALDIQQPIYGPQAWFIYSMRKRGENIQDMVLARTRQIIELEVAVRYFSYLASKDMEAATEQAIAEAETLVKEVSSLCQRGMAMPSQQLRAETALLARQTDRRNNQRDQLTARAALLDALGLLPFAEIEFAYSEPPPPPEGQLEELVAEALRNRLELHAADQALGVAEDNIGRSIAAFLPNLYVFGGLSYNTDSFLARASSLVVGLDGVMTCFDGFRNVAEYHKAKAEKEQAFIRREQQCFAVMLEVVRGHTALAKERDSLIVAEKTLEAAALQLRETQARAREGLLPASDLLDAVVATDLARTHLTVARFRLHVAAIALQHAVESNPFAEPAEQTDGKDQP